MRPTGKPISVSVRVVRDVRAQMVAASMCSFSIKRSVLQDLQRGKRTYLAVFWGYILFV